MTNVKLAMEYAAKIDREALKKRLGGWAGLTDDEIKAIVGRGDHGGIGLYTRDLFKKIEDKLREKNT